MNTSDVHPSRHELHEQFNNPVKSSRRVVTHSVGRSMKSPASVDRAGSEMDKRLIEISYSDPKRKRKGSKVCFTLSEKIIEELALKSQKTVLPTYNGTRNKIEAPADTEKNASVTVV